ncbi:MAG: PBP1A family penicillin-binding protein [Acidobacteriaceae bacterium]|nr:PBP1A family penicillin-binding protein [Acidobacteriaceae bacterium]
MAAFLVIALIWVSFVYARYARLTDEKLTQGPFPNSSLLYAAPETVGVGDPGTPLGFAARLRESGYGEDARSNPLGWYHLRPDAIEVFPGDRSFTGSEPGVIRFNDAKISSIIALSDNTPRTEYTLEPQLLSSLYDKNREKRRLVHYDDIPPVLVQAVLSIEDKRFFQHSGFDPARIVKAVFVDLKQRRNAQGASTLTQQLARNLWLDPRKTFARKFDELLITIHLERKLTKQKIFEYYANQVDLGRRGSFAIRGFGEASEAYFGKNIRQLSIPEAATLAGLIQQPSYRNPVRWPERAKARRDLVLEQMLENGYLGQSQYEAAIETPMVVAKQGIESADAPYFVDLVNEKLNDEFQDRDFQASGSKIYTTIDPQLQRDAGEAVTSGMREIEGLIAKRRKEGVALEEPQVALICLDPKTGEVKALIGGKNYGASQLDHAVAKRPSGSIIKPFVYAAALNTGLWDHPNPITASSVFQDQPQTFYYGGKAYEPVDFHKDAWMGDVTLRTAFIKSLNVPTVEVAEQTGYGAVAELAHKAGLPEIRATPAMALGAYDVTPLEIAEAYTMFANKGIEVTPQMISKIVDQSGNDIWSSESQTKKVLDPRVSFLTLNLMQGVLNNGTGAGVRARGFSLPAAGKTGTSHDAWFAGFTTKLLCVVWVGLDDYQDIKMEGAKAALPIWTEFMKRAHRHRAYRDVSQFDVPEGVVSAQIDADTGQLATSLCPRVITEYYLLGTQPVQFCPLHPGGATEIASWDAVPAPSLPTAPAYPNSGVPAASPETAQNPGQPDGQKDKQDTKKHGLLDKLKSIFK